MPCATLEITISSKVSYIPQKIEEIIKPITLKKRIVLICILEDNQPAKGVKIAVATIFPVTTQEIWSCVAPIAPLMSDNAIEAIVTFIA